MLDLNSVELLELSPSVPFIYSSSVFGLNVFTLITAYETVHLLSLTIICLP